MAQPDRSGCRRVVVTCSLRDEMVDSHDSKMEAPMPVVSDRTLEPGEKKGGWVGKLVPAAKESRPELKRASEPEKKDERPS